MWRELRNAVIGAAILVALMLFALAPVKQRFVATLATYDAMKGALHDHH
jgi:hypothetical protein